MLRFATSCGLLALVLCGGLSAQDLLGWGPQRGQGDDGVDDPGAMVLDSARGPGRSSIVGSVYDQDAVPLAQALVELRSLSFGALNDETFKGESVMHTYSEVDGRFSLVGIPRGRYLLTIMGSRVERSYDDNLEWIATTRLEDLPAGLAIGRFVVVVEPREYGALTEHRDFAVVFPHETDAGLEGWIRGAFDPTTTAYAVTMNFPLSASRAAEAASWGGSLRRAVSLGALPDEEGRVQLPGVSDDDLLGLAVELFPIDEEPARALSFTVTSRYRAAWAKNAEGQVELKVPETGRLRVRVPGLEAVPFGQDRNIHVDSVPSGKETYRAPRVHQNEADFLLPHGTYRVSSRFADVIAVPRNVVIDGVQSMVEIELELVEHAPIEFDILDLAGEPIDELSLMIETKTASLSVPVEVSGARARVRGLEPGVYRVWVSRVLEGSGSVGLMPLTLELGPDMEPFVVDFDALPQPEYDD